jgi:hypothetical protein
VIQRTKNIIRLGLKWLLILFVGLIVIYAIARFYVVYTESVIKGERAPYLQMQASDGITVSWHTEESEIGVVHYGLEIDDLNHSVKDVEAKDAHELRLTRLKPATRYYYSVGNQSSVKYGGTDAHWFMTALETGSTEAVRILVLGDSGLPGEVLQAVNSASNKWLKENHRENKPLIDQWLMLGDNAYTSGTNDQYQKAIFDIFPHLLKNTTLWPAYGNHDARRWAFFRIFALPENGEAGGVPSATEHYYSFNYANIHFVMLDSQDKDRSPDGEMLQWLDQDLQVNNQEWVIVAFHHPPYTKGTHDSDDPGDSGGRLIDMRENVLPVLEKHGVDLVLAGHSHVYERSKLIDCHYGYSSAFTQNNVVSDGVDGLHLNYLKPKGKQPHSGAVYIVAGASSKAGAGSLDHPAMATSMLETGSLIIDVEGDKLIGRFVNRHAIVVDEFTLSKIAGYKSSYGGCEY